jgi:peptide/nickel transport system substrate-binding protein
MDHDLFELNRRLSRRAMLRGASAVVAMGAAGSLLAACGSGGNAISAVTTAATTAADEGAPKPGGRLRVGMSTGGSTDTLDPHSAISTIDAARAGALFDRLALLGEGGKVELDLAESFEPNADATEWTVRLRDGVTWHDGKPLTVDDVMYTIRRVGDPASTSAGKAKVAVMDLKNLKKVDQLTLKIPLLQPIADLPVSFTIFYMAIIQDGATDVQLTTSPIGTGAFTFKSFEPGKNSLFVKNPNYWKEGKPYVDELVLESIPDTTARFNAMLGGQVDLVEALNFQQALEVQQSGAFNVLQTIPGQIVPMTMRTDTKPFDDLRVRQAMRLIADRPALIQNAQLGVGEVANDLFGQGTEFYNDLLPQRGQDLEQAKSLLKAAGYENLKVELNTSQVAPGMLESAIAFAEQAKGAGVEVALNKIPDGEFYGAGYLKYPFGMTQWTSQPIPSWLEDAVVTGAAYNETAWNRPEFDKLVTEARGELDTAKRQEKYFEIQKTLFEEGGYLIWGVQPFNDGIGSNVRGVKPISAQALGNYQFRDYWLA